MERNVHQLTLLQIFLSFIQVRDYFFYLFERDPSRKVMEAKMRSTSVQFGMTVESSDFAQTSKYFHLFLHLFNRCSKYREKGSYRLCRCSACRQIRMRNIYQNKKKRKCGSWHGFLHRYIHHAVRRFHRKLLFSCTFPSDKKKTE